MILRSLRWRLILAGGGAIVLALVLAALGLALLFERHVERVAVADLEARAMAVAALVEPQPDGPPAFRKVASDPLYEQPFSGHYWQIGLGPSVLRSRSLWDFGFPPAEAPPDPAPPQGRRVLALTGPLERPLLALEWWLEVRSGGESLPLRIIVARDRAELDNARQGFLSDLLPYLGLLGLCLLAASSVQITVGLHPLRQIRAQVAALRSGQRARLGPDMPQEVQPLAAEIDALLDARDDELAKARHRAGDLAHGFKTPLQALMGDARLLRDRGEADIAQSIELVAGSMRRLVDHELARARIRSDRLVAAVADPAVVIGRVVAVLQRTPAGAELDWQVDVAPGLAARIDPADLTEAVGALAENAVQHARRRIAISARRDGAHLAITLRDDGPGAPDAALTRLRQRGARLDEAGDNHGLGLAIVADIAAAAGGELMLRNATPGLEVTLRLLSAAKG